MSTVIDATEQIASSTANSARSNSATYIGPTAHGDEASTHRGNACVSHANAISRITMKSGAATVAAQSNLRVPSGSRPSLRRPDGTPMLRPARHDATPPPPPSPPTPDRVRTPGLPP